MLCCKVCLGIIQVRTLGNNLKLDEEKFNTVNDEHPIPEPPLLPV